MAQIARNLTDLNDGFLRGKHYLILDLDTKYSGAFRSVLSSKMLAGNVTSSACMPLAVTSSIGRDQGAHDFDFHRGWQAEECDVLSKHPHDSS